MLACTKQRRLAERLSKPVALDPKIHNRIGHGKSFQIFWKQIPVKVRYKKRRITYFIKAEKQKSKKTKYI